MPKIQFIDTGLIDYNTAWQLQEKLLQSTINIKIQNQENKKNISIAHCPLPIVIFPTPNYLIFCEHPHVFTLGKSGSESNLLVNEQDLFRLKAQFIKNNRGGDITYHGPGQLVAYPVFDLENFTTDIHKYLRSLEEAVILTLSELDISSGRIAGLTGVWVDYLTPEKARKICAIGVRTSRWVTMHGLALNVNTDLSYFNYIVPCGITDKAVTSIKKETGKEISLQLVKNILLMKMGEVFGVEIQKILKENQGLINSTLHLPAGII